MKPNKPKAEPSPDVFDDTDFIDAEAMLEAEAVREGEPVLEAEPVEFVLRLPLGPETILKAYETLSALALLLETNRRTIVSEERGVWRCIEADAADVDPELHRLVGFFEKLARALEAQAYRDKGARADNLPF